MAEPIISNGDSKEVRICLMGKNALRQFGADLQALILSPSNLPVQIKLQRIDAPTPGPIAKSVRARLSRWDPHVIFLILPDNNRKQAQKLIRSVRLLTPRPIMVVLKAGEPEDLIQLLKLGIADFIVPPFNLLDILPRLWRLFEHSNQEDLLHAKMKAKIGLRQMVGQDPVFLAEINKIPIVAPCDASVLILGETGTGKEICARAIHYLSRRSAKPFVPVNCGAIPSELVENELFGHVKGAFTGASKAYFGLISAANGGTLFLDEIDCLPLAAQSKLMRFLQDKEYRQLGSTRFHKADIRFVAASNLDLSKAVSDGKFRRDLYYRVNVIPLSLPRLRDRQRDIVLLAEHFLKRYVRKYNRSIEDFSTPAIQKLLLHDWPGNVRELENVVQRAVIFARQSTIQAADIALTSNDCKVAEPPKSFQEMKAQVIADFEKSYIQELLISHRGNISHAAQAACKNRRSFWELIRKHQIDVQRYKRGFSEKDG